MEEENQPGDGDTSWFVSDDIDWGALWTEVYIRTELPFWMMVGPTDMAIEISGHTFPVSVSDHSYEYFWNSANDSKSSVIYRGSRKTEEELSPLVDLIRLQDPKAQIVERKCKTVVRITTRCNSHVAGMVSSSPRGSFPRPAHLYLEDLCRGHFEVLNRVIQAYRLATYDYFAFEVAPWDVPTWHVDFKNGSEATVVILPYKAWDLKPFIGNYSSSQTPSVSNFRTYSLIDPEGLRSSLNLTPSGGELELMDALGLFERGDYSGAVRRAVTALEIIVESSLQTLLTIHSGEEAAAKYMLETLSKFEKRVGKLSSLSGRRFPNWIALKRARELRHSIVHQGYRINAANKGNAEMTVDKCRWMFNWFENDAKKRDVRERRIALRSLGRDRSAGIFMPRIEAEGIILSSYRDREREARAGSRC